MCKKRVFKGLIVKYSFSLLWQLFAFFSTNIYSRSDGAVRSIYLSEYVRNFSEPFIFNYWVRTKASRKILALLAMCIFFVSLVIVLMIDNWSPLFIFISLLIAVSPALAGLLLKNENSVVKSNRMRSDLVVVFLYCLVATVYNRIVVYYVGVFDIDKNIEFLNVERILQFSANLYVSYINYKKIYSFNKSRVEYKFVYLIVPFFLVFPQYALLYISQLMKWLSTSLLIHAIEANKIRILTGFQFLMILIFGFLVYKNAINSINQMYAFDIATSTLVLLLLCRIKKIS